MALIEVSRHDLAFKPAQQIVLLVATFSNGSSNRGTGVLVGSNDILTAGHVVYSHANGWMEHLQLWFAADFNPNTNQLETIGEPVPWSSWTVTAWPSQIFSSSPAYTSTPQETQFDTALIGIDYAVGDVLGYLELNEGFNQTSIPFAASAYGYSSGFSALTRLQTVASKYGPSANMYTIPEQLLSGASGGPLLTANNEVIGVASAGSRDTGTQFSDISTVWPGLIEAYHQNDILLPSWAGPSWDLQLTADGKESFPTAIVEGRKVLITAKDLHYVADRISVQLSGLAQDDFLSKATSKEPNIYHSQLYNVEFATELTFIADDKYEIAERAELRATFYDDDSGYQETISFVFDVIDHPSLRSTSSLQFQHGTQQYQAAVLIEVAFGSAQIEPYLPVAQAFLNREDSLQAGIESLVASGLIETQIGSSNTDWITKIYSNITPPLTDLAAEEVFVQLLDDGETDRVELLTLACQSLMNLDALT